MGPGPETRPQVKEVLGRGFPPLWEGVFVPAGSSASAFKSKACRVGAWGKASGGPGLHPGGGTVQRRIGSGGLRGAAGRAGIVGGDCIKTRARHSGSFGL